MEHLSFSIGEHMYHLPPHAFELSLRQNLNNFVMLADTFGFLRLP